MIGFNCLVALLMLQVNDDCLNNNFNVYFMIKFKTFSNYFFQKFSSASYGYYGYLDEHGSYVFYSDLTGPPTYSTTKTTQGTTDVTRRDGPIPENITDKTLRDIVWQLIQAGVLVPLYLWKYKPVDWTFINSTNYVSRINLFDSKEQYILNSCIYFVGAPNTQNDEMALQKISKFLSSRGSIQSNQNQTQEKEYNLLVFANPNLKKNYPKIIQEQSASERKTMYENIIPEMFDEGIEEFVIENGSISYKFFDESTTYIV